VAEERLAFVLSGGGARGALQVGALRALLEHNIHPDLLTGTSIGAANAVFFGIDPTLEQVLVLERIWYEVAGANFLSANWAYLAIRTLLNRARVHPDPRIRDFLAAHLPTTTLRFRDLALPVYVVSTDLNHARMVVFGERKDDRVLDGVLASTAIPPWVRPLEYGDEFLMDGGVVSNLPIETAVRHGATHIIALDISQDRPVDPREQGFRPFLSKLLSTVSHRQMQLELYLAAQEGVVVHHVHMRTSPPVMIWDFSQAGYLLEHGYRLMQHYISEHEKQMARLLSADEQNAGGRRPPDADRL